MLLEHVGPGADQALLQIAVFLEHLAREDDGDRLGDVVGEERVGRLEMHAQGVPVGRLDRLDLLEREALHALFGIGLEAVLHVGGDEFASVERRHVLPLHALPQLERPDPRVGVALPALGEVPLEGEVGHSGGLVRERIAYEAIAGERRELEQPDRLGEARVDHRGIPGRCPREAPASPGRLRARRDPVGVRRRRLRERMSPACADGQGGRAGAGPSGTSEKVTSRHMGVCGLARVGGGHRSSPSLSET